jgi:hypothetical protein
LKLQGVGSATADLLILKGNEMKLLTAIIIGLWAGIKALAGWRIEG